MKIWCFAFLLTRTKLKHDYAQIQNLPVSIVIEDIDDKEKALGKAVSQCFREHPDYNISTYHWVVLTINQDEPPDKE